MNLFLFTLLTLFWGSAYLGIHYLLAIYPPFFAAGLRVGLATFVMVLMSWRLMRRTELSRSMRWQLAISGLFFMGFAWALLFWGQQFVAPAVAAILIAATPIFTALVLPWFDRTVHIARNQWIGILLGFVGIFCIFSPKLGSESHTELLGLLAILGTAFSYSITASLLHNITKARIPGQLIFIWQGGAALIFLLLLSSLMEPWPAWTALVRASTANLALGYLVLISTVCAFLIFYHLIRTMGSVATTTVTYTAPLVALFLDAIVLRSIPEWPVLLGASVVFAGIYLAANQHSPRQS